MKKLNLFGLICVTVLLFSTTVPIQAAPSGCPNSIIVVAFDKDGNEIGTFYLDTLVFFSYYQSSRIDFYRLGNDIAELICSFAGGTCLGLPGGYVYFGEVYRRTWLGEMMQWLTPGYYIVPIDTSSYIVSPLNGYERYIPYM